MSWSLNATGKRELLIAKLNETTYCPQKVRAFFADLTANLSEETNIELSTYGHHVDNVIANCTINITVDPPQQGSGGSGSGGAQVDNTLPATGSGAEVDNTLPSGAAKPDNTLPDEDGDDEAEVDNELPPHGTPKTSAKK